MLAQFSQLWSDGFQFVVDSYEGDYKVDDFSEIEDLISEVEEEDFLYFEEVSIDADAHVVYLFIGDDE